MNIEIRNLTKTFGSFTALKDVSLKISSGELVALLGPSGSGKTTLLRVIAGLETPDSGSVLYQGEDITYTSPRSRNVGLVFQHYALFGHLNVFENIAFGLKVRGMKGKAVRERVVELLRLIQLENFEKRFPSQLSGGQRQRVALARALAVKPRLLLLDEPFGSLDSKVRQELRLWLRRLHKEIQVTSVFVTHDQDEAFEVADRVVITNQGRIEQVGTPEEIYTSPANAFVVDFLGNVNILRGSVRAGRALFGSLEIPYPDYLGEEPRPARAYLRNHQVELKRNPDGPSYLPVEVTYVKNTGPSVKLGLNVADEETALHLAIPPEDWSRLGLAVGDQAWLVPRSLSVFVEGSGREATSTTVSLDPPA